MKPFKLDDVKDALKAAGVTGITVARGPRLRPPGRPHRDLPRSRVPDRLRPQGPPQFVVDDAAVDAVVETIVAAAATGKIGDGKIWVTDVDGSSASAPARKGPTRSSRRPVSTPASTDPDRDASLRPVARSPSLLCVLRGLARGSRVTLSGLTAPGWRVGPTRLVAGASLAVTPMTDRRRRPPPKPTHSATPAQAGRWTAQWKKLYAEVITTGGARGARVAWRPAPTRLSTRRKPSAFSTWRRSCALTTASTAEKG